MNREFTIPRGVQPVEETDTYGKYIFMPLEKGYGATVGNALRRVLLSSIPGASIIAARIDGVPHEFTTIEGILEDVPDIILNLKRVRIRYHGEDPQTVVHIRKSGKGEVRAGDIETASANLEVVNKDQLIATLTTDDASFEADLVVAKGRGYVPAAEYPQDFLPEGYIYIDGLFSPVTKVNFTVENVRVKERTDFEKLTLEIWTDGTITPGDAFREAVRLLIEIFQRLIRRVTGPLIERGISFEERERIKSLLLRDIEFLELSVRTITCLREEGIKSVADLVSRTREEMLKIKNFGEKSLEELEGKLSSLGLYFGMDVSQYLEEWAKDETQEKDT